MVPKENIQIYSYLYKIENGLRELIIKSLEDLDGPLWYKKRLPGDILEKYRKEIKIEKTVKWVQLVPHHPIYYVDFSDLKKILERKDNWDDAFKRIFGRQDILSSTLSELESIRNKIAHNRKATKHDLEVIKGAYAKLSEAIGKRQLEEFVMRRTLALDIPEQLIKLREECNKTSVICKNCEPLKRIDLWQLVQSEWWFDESYLGFKLDGIINYFKSIEEYSSLPRARGTGHEIEKWIKLNNIQEKYNVAQGDFMAILSTWGIYDRL